MDNSSNLSITIGINRFHCFVPHIFHFLSEDYLVGILSPWGDGISFSFVHIDIPDSSPHLRSFPECLFDFSIPSSSKAI